MLNTPFGTLEIFLDNKTVSYNIHPVSDSRFFPHVENAYLLVYDYHADGNEHNLSCIRDSQKEMVYAWQ